MRALNFDVIHPSWRPIVDAALTRIEPTYLQELEQNRDWLPGPQNIFNAFSLPLEQCKYILFGESPYPRTASANGYAFWDAAVHELWSENGLSKAVNRATSLRNWLKLLLVTNGSLVANDTSQQKIAALDKSHFITSIDEFFANLHQQGFLLLNASLVLSNHSVRKNAKAWRPFMESVLAQLGTSHPDITLVLFGKIAEEINCMPAAHCFKQVLAEHPYNLSFIQNKTVQSFFRPFHLLRKTTCPTKQHSPLMMSY